MCSPSSLCLSSPLSPSFFFPPCFSISFSWYKYLHTCLGIRVEARGLCQVSPCITLYLIFWDRVSSYTANSLIYLYWMAWKSLGSPDSVSLVSWVQHRVLAASLCLGGLWESELRFSSLQATNTSSVTSPKPWSGFTYAGLCLGGLLYVVAFVHSSCQLISLYLTTILVTCWDWTVVLGRMAYFFPEGIGIPFFTFLVLVFVAVIKWRRNLSLCCQ